MEVLKWLEEGYDNARDIVDLPWKVTKKSDGVYLAEYPKIPFVLNVVIDKEFVHLIVPLGVDTVALEVPERLKVYHSLLMLNDKLNLIKFCITGMNEEITLRVDLDRKTLGKGEFNDALTSLLIGLNEVIRALGLEEEFAMAVFERIVMMVLERLEKGAKKEDILNFWSSRLEWIQKMPKNSLGKYLKNQSQVKTLATSDYFSISSSISFLHNFQWKQNS
ncbi:DNA-binding protein [Thermococcus aggregans]|uniref:DNA-binding protein n=1 Tax=Thermococcus aggregans TaxID=110163 RepID=UPI003450ED3D